MKLFNILFDSGRGYFEHISSRVVKEGSESRITEKIVDLSFHVKK